MNDVQFPKKLERSHLKMQLTLLCDLAKGRKFSSFPEVAEFMSAVHPQTRELFKEDEAFVKLFLCQPVSDAPTERSFSALR